MRPYHHKGYLHLLTGLRANEVLTPLGFVYLFRNIEKYWVVQVGPFYLSFTGKLARDVVI